MLPPGLATPREVTRYYDSLYEALIDSGQAVPFTYPTAGLGAFTVIAYLLFDHRNNALRWLRLPIATTLFAFQIWCILTNKARHPAAAFGVGLLSAWGIFWVSTLLLATDCQTDFVRIERKNANTSVKHANGSVQKSNHPVAPQAPKDGLYWQPYPPGLLSRIDWVADAFCSFRGVGWNWQTSTVPSLPRPPMLDVPKDIQHADYKLVTISRIGIRRFREKKQLLYATWSNLVIGYFVLDVVKTLMHRDPYFWGYIDAPAPAYLPVLVQNSFFLTKSLRLLISMAGIYTALWEIFRLGPAFFCGLLGPKWVGLRGEAWMNPADMFGSFSCVLEDGLAGWWGGWWHQVFRVAFETHSKALLKALKIEPRSQQGKLIGLFIAFLMSGCLHASGSYTQLGDTRPFMGPMRFFMLQMLGIITQLQTVSLLRKAGILESVPKPVKQLANFVLVHTWLYYTAPLLVDDFARGGVWLFEPLAVSPLRGLGFGAPDDSWWCWWNGLLFWRSGKHWWDTGLAI